MSDGEDNSPPTEAEIRRWKKLEQGKKRVEVLALFLDDVGLDLPHDEWLKEERRKERARRKIERASSSASSKSPGEYDDIISDDELSEGSTGTVKPMTKTQSQPEPEYQTGQNINVHSSKKDVWFGALATVDSGTTENWISEDVVNRCALEVGRGRPILCATINGIEFETDRCVQMTWRREGVKKTQSAIFHVGQNAPFDVLFGSNIVKAAPELFRAKPADPALILTQKEKSEKMNIEKNRAEHKARSEAQTEKAREKKESGSYKKVKGGSQLEGCPPKQEELSRSRNEPCKYRGTGTSSAAHEGTKRCSGDGSQRFSEGYPPAFKRVCSWAAQLRTQFDCDCQEQQLTPRKQAVTSTTGMGAITPVRRMMLEAAIKYAVQEKVCLPNWQTLRAYLVDHAQLAASELDEEKTFVTDCYMLHTNPAVQQGNRDLDTPPKSPKNEPQTPNLNLVPADPLEGHEEAAFSPTLDNSPPKPSENLSIFIEHKNTWDGTCWDFCTEENSFISMNIVHRSSLVLNGNKIELTWKFHGEKKTYRTWFTAIEDQYIENDIMLGRGWDKVEYKSGERVYCGQEETMHALHMDTRSDYGSTPMHREFPTHLPSPEEFEACVGRMIGHSATTAVLDMALRQDRRLFPFPFSCREIPIRNSVGDASVSGGSQGQHQDGRFGPPLYNNYSEPARFRGPANNPALYTPVRPPESPPEC
ncbi:hypothetical protein G7Y89_g11348 [Cudoniella acicularis]|uniref:Uncharacterized protein n=1 Tax=Cudoniella acicularis TaxID=354080 RepID=A0A8H4RB23_9HELO|nr:hypothetical protein G7Y89_g11348 [Cudoniella acicularis]